MNARLFAASSSACLLLAACGEPAPQDQDTDMDGASDEIAEVAPEPAPAPVEPIEFSGAEERVLAFDTPLTDYRFVAEFQTDVRVEDAPYSNTFPPMPLLSNVLIVSQRETSFLIQTRGAAGEQTLGSCGFAAPCRIVVDSGPDGASIQIKDGEPVVFDAPLPMERLVAGRGFQDRYWTGVFSQLTICDAAGEERAFGQDAACAEG